VPLPVDGVKEYVGIDDRLATVRSIYLNLPPQAEELLKDAWGPPNEVKEHEKDVYVWLDSETQWRATWRPALGVNHDLFFDNYIPAEKLLGDQPDTLGGLPAPVLGKTVDEVKKAYKEDLQNVIPNKQLVLTLLPTEWDHAPTRIELDLAGGKVRALSFSIPYKGHPADKEALQTLFQSKWGEPKEVDDQNGKPILLFHEEDPRVEVRLDETHGAWSITLR